MGTTPNRIQRRTSSLNRQQIVAAAVEILDDGGEDALTFRALASRLSTGAGAIYWHISGKDELLAAAASSVVERAIAAVPDDGQPREHVRMLALALFDEFDAHPWVGSQLAREFWRVGNTLILEAIGSRLPLLDVPATEQFDAASALLGYICGTASQNASHARSVPAGMNRETYLHLSVERWEKLDAESYPFLHRVTADLPQHDDRSQFLAGVDYLLAGILGRP